MAITGFPWFKIYAAEALSDEHFMSWEPAQRGIWFTLLCHCWKEGSIPSDIDKLARLSGCDATAMQLHWPCIAHRFQVHPSEPSRLISPRLEFERYISVEDSIKKSDRGRANARARWDRKKSDATAMQLQCNCNANSMQKHAPQPQPKVKIVKPLLESSTMTTKEKKVSKGNPWEAIFPGVETHPLWEGFWALSKIWPEGSNIRKKDSALAYIEARALAEHECIFAWAEWTLRETQGKITTLASWLSNQDWVSRQKSRVVMSCP